MGKKNSKLKQETIDSLTHDTYCKFRLNFLLLLGRGFLTGSNLFRPVKESAIKPSKSSIHCSPTGGGGGGGRILIDCNSNAGALGNLFLPLRDRTSTTPRPAVVGVWRTRAIKIPIPHKRGEKKKKKVWEGGLFHALWFVVLFQRENAKLPVRAPE